MSKRSEAAPLTAVLVGCGGMGRNQARILADLEGFELVAVCDLDQGAARSVGEECGADAYTDFARMLDETSPDTVSVCTSSASHAPLTVQAAGFGVRGIYCEKPMATNLADARRAVRACGERGSVLVINHQRRLGADLREARRLIEAGAVGDVHRIRGSCGGDLLSDGTHMVDSIMWLTGDGPGEWALGQVHREINAAMRERTERQGRRSEPGFRYGHPVENGGVGLVQLASGPRVELLWGDMREAGRHYQDYEVFGTEGRLWRTNSRFSPNLFIQDAEGGTWEAGSEDGWLKPMPNEGGAPGCWRPVEVEWDDQTMGIPGGYRLFARAIREGAEHPMSGEKALRGFEILMSILESARTHRRIEVPPEQERYPLELMMEAGEA